MNETDPKPAEGSDGSVDGSPPRTAPPSWKLIGIGLCVAGAATALCAALLVTFLESRPVDLRALTKERAADLERLFAYNQIPESSIVKSDEEDRRTDTARWTFREYRVDLPPALSLTGVERLIRRTMAERNVSVFDEPETPADRAVLRFEAAGQLFATLTLTGTPELENFTEASRRLAHETLDLLTKLDPSAERVERAPVQPRENSEARWELAPIDVWVTAAGQVQSIVDEATSTLSRTDVDLRVEMDETSGETRVTVLFRGLECVQAAIHAPVSHGASLSDESMPEQTGDDSTESTVTDSESLPLDSAHLNGDARDPAPIARSAIPGGVLRVAIIVDDGGYGGDITEDVLALDPRLTLSILPGAPHSADTAQRAAALGFEIMLHMPMENSSEHGAYPDQITVAMPAEKIHELTLDALEDVPGAVGINNHTGSRFTSDPEAMRAFLTGIQPLDLFFVDSRTISTSTAYEIALEMDIPCAARDLFLDHESDKDYIREQFDQLIELCVRQGSAIGICHFRRNSVAVLREKLPEFEEREIALVHVSELVE